MRMRGAWWAAPCLLLPAVLAVPAATGKVLLFRDLLHFIAPQQAYAAAARAAGRLPLWDPGRYGGAPFFAEPGSGFFYPPNLIFNLLPPAEAATWFVLLHLPIAAAGAYLLARRLSCEPPAAALAASGYAASGYLLSMHGGHYYLASAALLPGICAALLGVRSARSLVVAAALVALAVFNGEYQGLFFAGLIALVLAASDERLRGAARVAGALALGTALGAVQLIPNALFARETVRAQGVGLAEASLWPLHPLRWLELVAAAPFGLPFPDNGYWGSVLVSGTHQLPWAVSIYLGPALLVPAIAVGWRKRALAAVALGSLLLAAGTLLPFFRFWLLLVPLADRFRYAEKYALPATLALCLLGASAAQELAGSARRAIVAFASCAAVLAAAAAVAWRQPAWLAREISRGLAQAGANLGPDLAHAQLTGSLGQAALICAALAVGAAACRRRPEFFVPMLLGASVLAQAGHGLEVLSYGDGSFLRREPAFLAPWRAAQVPGGTGRVLNDGSCAFRGEGDGTLMERVRAHQWDHAKENFPLLFGLREALGYGAAENLRQVAVVQRLRPTGLVATARALGASAILGCDASGALRITPVERALPRLSVDGDAARATLREDLPERERISARGPGLLILAETAAPGWTAAIDGAPVPLLETPELFRSVTLPPGEHEVTFDYSAPGLRAGAIISAIAALACLALLFLRLRPAGTAPGSP